MAYITLENSFAACLQCVAQPVPLASFLHLSNLGDGLDPGWTLTSVLAIMYRSATSNPLTGTHSCWCLKTEWDASSFSLFKNLNYFFVTWHFHSTVSSERALWQKVVCQSGMTNSLGMPSQQLFDRLWTCRCSPVIVGIPCMRKCARKENRVYPMIASSCFDYVRTLLCLFGSSDMVWKACIIVGDNKNVLYMKWHPYKRVVMTSSGMRHTNPNTAHKRNRNISANEIQNLLFSRKSCLVNHQKNLVIVYFFNLWPLYVATTRRKWKLQCFVNILWDFRFWTVWAKSQSLRLPCTWFHTRARHAPWQKWFVVCGVGDVCHNAAAVKAVDLVVRFAARQQSNGRLRFHPWLAFAYPSRW